MTTIPLTEAKKSKTFLATPIQLRRMLLFRSDIVKVVSLTTLLIAIVLITIIIAESPNLRQVDLKLLPNNSSSASSARPSREEPSPAAQQPNPNYLGNNNLGNQLQPNAPPNYPSLIGMLAPALLPGLNSAEQQISPYQLRNASPQQLQRLRQMQEMQQLQRQQGGGAGPLTNLIGAFLPGGGQLLGGGLNQANNRLNNNNNNLQNGQVGNQNPATLAQLLGLTPQQPLNNPYNQVSQLNNNGLQRANVYGQPNRNARPNANLRRANPESDNSGNSVDNNSADNGGGGEENDADNSGNEDNSGDNGEGQDQSNQPQQDPSQDPDIQQFNNLNGNDGNFPGDLFPAGILSENDLKDIQKSMEEQAKKEAEKQRQQEAAGNGEAEDSGNSEDNGEDNGEGSDQTNSDDQSNTTDQSADDQSANQEENANQTESPQDETNSELKNQNEQDPSKATGDAEPVNNGKLNVGLSAGPKSGLTGNTILANKKPPTINSYSYNSLRPNGVGNGNSNVQYEDDRPLLNGNRQTYRPKSYVSSNANIPANRNFNGLQRQQGNRGQADSPYRTPGVGYSRDRSFQNDFRPSSRFNGDTPVGANPFNNYGSGVDYSPEYNQDPSGAGLYGGSPGAGLYNGGGGPGSDYNPMSNYRPNELLNNHVSRQHGDINNFNYNNLRPRTRNPLNAGRVLDRHALTNGLANDRSAVNYEPE